MLRHVILAAIFGTPFSLGGAFMLGQLVRDALRMSDISIKQAAILMDLDHSQLVRQLDGVENLSLRRMQWLPKKFFSWFFFLGLLMVGMPKAVRRAVPVTLAMMGRRRMLRLELAVEKAEKAS